MPSLRRLWLFSLAALIAAGCTIPPRPGSPVPPAAEVVPSTARAQAYGSTIDEVLRNPDVGGKIRELFGPAWSLASPGGGGLTMAASAYFGKGGPPRMVRVGGVDYVAITGCVPSACDTNRVLVLIREGGSELLARLDEGGFAHYYAYGNVSRDAAPLVVDSGLRALERVGKPYPSATS